MSTKKVIVPDEADAEGRGSSRRFSARNILEFTIASILSEFHFPVAMSGNLLYAMRSFETSIQKTINNFRLPYTFDEF